MNYENLENLNKAQALDHLSKSLQISPLLEAGITDEECIDEIKKAVKEIAIELRKT